MSWSRLVVIAFLVSLSGGCAARAAGGAAAASPESRATAARITSGYAVYFPGEPPADLAARISALAGSRFARVPAPELEAGKDPRALSVLSVPASELPPPSREYLELFGRGIEPADLDAVGRTSRVVLVAFAMPAGDTAALKAASELLGTLSTERRALIWDMQTRELFSASFWHDMRVASFQGDVPDVRGHITIHAYPKGEGLRAITLGMQKFGQPDIVVDEVPRSYADSMSSVINLVCQTLIEGRRPFRGAKLLVSVERLAHRDLRQSLLRGSFDGARGRAELRLRPIRPEEGDPDNEIYAIDFGAASATAAERHSALLAAIFGAGEDPAVQLEHDQEMLAASARAVSRLLSELKPRFVRGLAPGERLLVKGPFVTGDGNGREWMWLEVTSWKADEIAGVLMNEPNAVRGLHVGSPVSIREGDAFDFIFDREDGTSEGNETGKIMERRMRGRR